MSEFSEKDEHLIETINRHRRISREARRRAELEEVALAGSPFLGDLIQASIDVLKRAQDVLQQWHDVVLDGSGGAETTGVEALDGANDLVGLGGIHGSSPSVGDVVRTPDPTEGEPSRVIGQVAIDCLVENGATAEEIGLKVVDQLSRYEAQHLANGAGR